VEGALEGSWLDDGEAEPECGLACVRACAEAVLPILKILIAKRVRQKIQFCSRISRCVSILELVENSEIMRE